MSTPVIPANQTAGAGSDVLARLKTVIASSLAISHERVAAFDRDTALFGSLPELDSLAVVQLVYALEEHFGIEVESDDITGELFETLGNLASYVESKLQS